MVQRALELSGAAESALVWPRFLAGTLGRGTERMYPFARVPTDTCPFFLPRGAKIPTDKFEVYFFSLGLIIC